MEDELTPFLKWAGGKRWFVNKYSHLLPKKYGRYIEPFLGSGVVFFFMLPKESILNDINKELIDTYRALQSNWEKVYELLEEHHRRHSKEYYYYIRSKVFNKLEESAAKTIYLNRTCFNGIYRVNRHGKFNVPIGSKTNVLLETDNFSGIANALKNVKLYDGDFEEVILQAENDDFLFVDPPYTVRHNQNGFIKYNEILFSWKDQLRLAKSLIKAKNRGAKIILTNASHNSIRELYQPHGFDLRVATRYSSISATAKNRSNFEELIIMANINVEGSNENAKLRSAYSELNYK